MRMQGMSGPNRQVREMCSPQQFREVALYRQRTQGQSLVQIRVCPLVNSSSSIVIIVSIIIVIITIVCIHHPSSTLIVVLPP